MRTDWADHLFFHSSFDIYSLCLFCETQIYLSISITKVIYRHRKSAFSQEVLSLFEAIDETQRDFGGGAPLFVLV